MKRLKKITSVFLSVVIVVNFCSVIELKSQNSVSKDLKETYRNLISRSAEYLKSRANEDGSIGDSSVINDTASALGVLRKIEGNDVSAYAEWTGKKYNSMKNNDTEARMLSALGNPAYFDLLKDSQNEDGGFGLIRGYKSDLLDSVLVLEAIVESGYNENNISSDKLAEYITASAADDGSCSYNEYSYGDPVLTAMAAGIAGKYYTISQKDISVPDNMKKYIENNISDDYSDAGIEKTLYKDLALVRMNEKYDKALILEKLENAEKTNGSFADDVSITALALKLLLEIDVSRSIRVTDFTTDLGNVQLNAGHSDELSAIMKGSFKTTEDENCSLVFSVYNGDEKIFENSSELMLKADETSFTSEPFKFTFSDPSDNGIYTVSELYNSLGEQIAKNIVNLRMTENTPEAKTELSDFYIEFDNEQLRENTKTNITASCALLYTSNIAGSAEFNMALYKNDEKVTEKSEKVDFRPSETLVKIPMIISEIDTSSDDKYVFKAECIYNGSKLFEDTKEICVIKSSETDILNADSDVTEETVFDAICPLPDYCSLYACEDSEVKIKNLIFYRSAPEKEYSVSVKAESDGKIIAEESKKLLLPASVDDTEGSNIVSSNILTDDILCFSASEPGTVTVTSELLDSDGKVLVSGSKKISVLNKPETDLILHTEIDKNSSEVSLSWNDISDSQSTYTYKLNRKVDNEEWKTRSIWNESEKIKVLNVYPLQPYLSQWMTAPLEGSDIPAGKEQFDIDSVNIREFNADPAAVLYDSKGNSKYDVIFFGSSDCNSNCDLSDSAYTETQKFVDEGRGVLFGHDTLCKNLGHMNFCKFEEQLGILVINDTTIHQTESVKVLKIGTLTNYPWEIRGELKVPTCHSSGQYVGGTLAAEEWMSLNVAGFDHKETNPHPDFYLVSNNNLAMIQTGHSNGYATDDERKVLANTLFYLYQTTRMTDAKDSSFYDVTPPDKPVQSDVSFDKGEARVTLHSKDNPTNYEYYISADPSDDQLDIINSNVEKQSMESGLAGFATALSNSADPDPSLVKYDENNEFVQNIVKADADGNAVLSIKPEDNEVKKYIHIFAVDNANNVSEECIIPFADAVLKTSINTDRKIYANGESAKISTDTVSEALCQTADVKIEIYDEFGNLQTVIDDIRDQKLDADINLDLDKEWTIPVDLKGKYQAQITWSDSDDVIAEADTKFRISGNTSVSNTVDPDKKEYSSALPVNLSSTVSNLNTDSAENDLVLEVSVLDEENSEVLMFEHNISTLFEGGSVDFSDAAAPGKLKAGKYLVNAVVKQDSDILSSDSTEFSIVEDSAGFTGNLKFTKSGEDMRADFSVEENGNGEIKNAEITVDIFDTADNKLIASIKQNNNFGDSRQYSSYDIIRHDLLKDGHSYSGVLRVTVNSDSKDLDYDGFTYSENKKEQKVSSSPDTGENDIPAGIWISSILSIFGILLLNRKRVNKDED